MKTFHLSAEVTVTATTIVRAKSKEDAIAAAEGRQVEIGGFGSGASEKDVWVIEDADGEAQNIRVDNDNGGEA
jgi:hypothetical protein